MIFIVGHHDTGKSTLARFLVDNGFLHVETGDIVRGIFRSSGTGLPFGEWAKQNGHHFDDHIIDSVNRAKDQALRENKQDVVITGNRQLEGIRQIRQSVEPLEQRKHLIVYMEADSEILFQRHQHRNDRRVQDLTIESFKRDILGYDKEMGVERIREEADLVLCNNCNILGLYSCFSSRFKAYGYQLNPPLEGQDYCPMRRK
ncbi:MAG: AAA family ATPase [Candidatus Shapirobacteria bacterium]|nr:AAA family ATPase [Candidatus Shapirobacteria bacterium]